ncbi:hypothetical protein X953_01660 [Virgibacillus sp. SK37]|nr:hypothetical protein X953_01660 [Virgibacillus sp. SK37]
MGADRYKLFDKKEKGAFGAKLRGRVKEGKRGEVRYSVVSDLLLVILTLTLKANEILLLAT